MTVYSTQFILGQVPGGGNLEYQVPSGFVAVLRDVEMLNSSSGTMSLTVALQDSSGTTQGVVAIPRSIAAGAVQAWSGRTVLNAGQYLQISAGAAGLFAIASGYLLSS